MDGCQTCQGNCCQKGNITIFHDEYERLLKYNTPIPHRNTDLLYLVYGPCPFLIDNRCTIYNDRTQTCRRYPLYIRRNSQAVTIDFNVSCPPFSPNSKLIHPENDIPKDELIAMIGAALESDARLNLAEFFLSPYDTTPALPFIDSSKKQLWIEEIAEQRAMSHQRYHELIAVFIVELLGRPSYRIRLEKEYPERLKIYDEILKKQ